MQEHVTGRKGKWRDTVGERYQPDLLRIRKPRISEPTGAITGVLDFAAANRVPAVNGHCLRACGIQSFEETWFESLLSSASTAAERQGLPVTLPHDWAGHCGMNCSLRKLHVS